MVVSLLADEDRHPLTVEDRGEVAAGRGLVCRDAGFLGDLQDVELMMGYAVPLIHRELRGADIHPPVKLHRVGVDDLTVQHQSQGDGEVGLAGRGRADHGQDSPTGTVAAGRGGGHDSGWRCPGSP